MTSSEPAGNFPYTIDLYQPTTGTRDDLGHNPVTFANVGQCAARVWTASVSGTPSDPADLVTVQPRLLLKEPIAALAINWRVMWKGKLYSIEATEERGFDLLVTLSPVARTA